MITVIIPALNEEKTIGNVVRFCLSQAHVSEVIVIDDNSTDATSYHARGAGAIVITSEKIGKGISMKEGISYASNDIIVFLDGDIDPYPANTITSMTEDILNDECDFVKATFSRDAGRVTELVAKPLLGILFPELASFSQPLSGMIAGRRELFRKIKFLSDYGVDVGILIDVFHLRARIREVNIGYIRNKSKPWHALVKMSQEVTGAILQKALFNRVAPLPRLDYEIISS